MSDELVTLGEFAAYLAADMREVLKAAADAVRHYCEDSFEGGAPDEVKAAILRQARSELRRLQSAEHLDVVSRALLAPIRKPSTVGVIERALEEEL